MEKCTLDKTYELKVLAEINKLSGFKNLRDLKHCSLDDTSVGLACKFERMRRGIRQKSMAKALGISLDTYKKYEQGKNKLALEAAINLCRICRISITSFIRLCEYFKRNKYFVEIKTKLPAKELPPSKRGRTNYVIDL